jgi:hypothetical protein
VYELILTSLQAAGVRSSRLTNFFEHEDTFHDLTD